MSGSTQIANSSVTPDRLFSATVKFRVLPEMSPRVKALFYYVKGDKESVADTISLMVSTKLENAVSVRFKSGSAAPGEKTRLQVSRMQYILYCRHDGNNL